MQKHQDPVSVIVASSLKPKYSPIPTLGINRLLHNILQKEAQSGAATLALRRLLQRFKTFET